MDKNVNNQSENDTIVTKPLYTIKEVAIIMQTNKAYVYKLVNKGLLPALKLGSYKVRHESLMEFLRMYEGYDLRDPSKISKIAS